MRYQITIEYNGTNYCGWQRQKNALSIQEVLEEKLSLFFQEKIIIIGSGRTDSGVHALGQVAHFDTPKEYSTHKIQYGVNSLLPRDIRMVDCKTADSEFHAQYSAQKKTYIYKSYVSRVSSPTKEHLYAQIVPPIDCEKMRAAAAKLIGEHDFIAFSSTGGSVKSTVREIYCLQITQQGEEIIFEIEGNGFLYNMVRIIVGTLIYIGKGTIPEENIDLMLTQKSRKLGGKTYPACGLYLKEVKYPNM